MKVARKLAVAITGFALSLAAMEAKPAHAYNPTTQSPTFYFNGTFNTGSLAGNKYSGTYSYDTSKVSSYSPSFYILDTLSLNISGSYTNLSYNLGDFSGGSLNYNGANEHALFVGDYRGKNGVPFLELLDSFYFQPPTYDSFFLDGKGYESQNTVSPTTISQQVPRQSVPEPQDMGKGVLLALGCGWLMKRKVASSRPTAVKA